MSEFDISVPVVIVGGGACGAVAALAARDAGAEVLIVEQDAVPHGTTSQSQGLVCGAGTRAQAALGIDDDADRFLADILRKVDGQTDPLLARAIAEESGPAIDWLIEAHDLPWELDIRFKAAYGHTRERVHGWMGRSGSDLIQLLHARATTHGVELLPSARLVDIVVDPSSRVHGIVVERPDGNREAIGCDALVLAAGGFAANRAMVEQYLPDAAAARCNGHEGNQGDAIRFGLALGAAVGDMGAYQGYGMLTDPQAVSVAPGVIVEGGLIVNFDGRRFVDETADISGIVHPVLAQPGGGAWVIFDADIEARCAYVPETQLLRSLKAPREALDVDGLAAVTGLDPAALAASLADAERARSAGGIDAVGRRWSDRDPPRGPFRALKVTGALYHTQGGLQIDRAARVLRPDGSAFPNLFAGGGTARSVSGPASWGYLPAMGLCTAVTFGRLAGQAAAAVAAAASPVLR